MDVTIAAIPGVDDYIWKLSSEKVPHLTMLYLEGVDEEKVPHISAFVKHVAETTMHRFGLNVDRRDTLGDKKADVVFLEGFDLAMLKRVRQSLLGNEAIDKAHLVSPQFPEWIPHLTLGYPDTPANEDKRDYPGIHYINFDKIVVWYDDYAGDEYRLKDQFEELMDASHSDIRSFGASVANGLFHHGVKGMKWGVRKDDSGSSDLTGLGSSSVSVKSKSGDTITLTQKPPNRLNKMMAKRSSAYKDEYNNSAYFTIRNASGKVVGDAAIQRRNADELYLNWIGIRKDSRGQGYASAILRAAEKHGHEMGFSKMTLEVPGNSPDARHIYEKLGFRVTKEGDPSDIWGGLTEMVYEFDKTSTVSHAESRDDFAWFVKAFVEELNLIDEELMDVSHTDIQSIGVRVVDGLFHYGTKGMKWGVRKDDSGGTSSSSARAAKNAAKRAPTDVSVTQKRPGTKVTATGGKNQPASSDATKAASTRQKAKASTVDSLSNQELQELVKRMNLEQQYKNLSAQQQSAGSKFLRKLFEDAAKRQVTSTFNEQADAYGTQVRDKLNS